MKKFTAFLLAFLLFIGLMPANADAASKIKVQVHGSLLTFDVQPYMENNRVLVPLRGVFEKLGGEVIWDNKAQAVTVKHSGGTVYLKLNSKNVQINGVQKTIDVPAKLKNGRTFVPLRFVGEAMGAAVDWSANYQTVYIFSGELTSFLKPFTKGMTKADIEKLVSVNKYFDLGNGEVIAYAPVKLYGHDATAEFDILKKGLMTVTVSFLVDGEVEAIGKKYSDKVKVEYGDYTKNRFQFYDYSSAWEQYLSPINNLFYVNANQRSNGKVEVKIEKIMPDIKTTITIN
ncbi:copper amine oxidase N-terminal domain-containing protein [Fictibacillus nanhaiensis]|uniref:copper amine oxidase N-terminal domain-containing protein n=1 Tax=Fictibacillus nanhaiensis TaxID=742169 RepID=UPI00203F1036|nr:copper amine oxidase N-terminal domain-containing protein [Fictibacillus nanhaiensis]MCM3733441.1 copper amine oxidase N-terminal domain-containing protein [Fictibacillus nanhaiensis]